MRVKARLAASEFDKNTNVNVRRSTAFPGSTLHGHDFYELDIITNGNSYTLLNGKRYELAPGTIFFMTPTDFHEYEYLTGFDLYNIQFTNDAISSELLEVTVKLKQNVFNPDEKSFNEIIRLVSVMYDLNQSDLSEIQTRILESILLLLIKSKSTEKKTPRESDTPNKDIQRAVMYIHAHFKENPSLSAVAATLPLNSKYFCTKFKEYTGETYKEYLKRIKLRYARRLILATSFSITDVAEHSGYSSQSHFNREFKDYYGVSPLALRKSEKKIL